MRDLRMIYDRMKKLLDIRSPANYSRDKSWDLWGPFLVCILISRYAALTSILTLAETRMIAQIFSSVFLINVFGAAVITANSRLLGCNL